MTDESNSEHLDALLEEKLRIVLEEKLKAIFEGTLNAILDNKLKELHLSISKLTESIEEVKKSAKKVKLSEVAISRISLGRQTPKTTGLQRYALLKNLVI